MSKPAKPERPIRRPIRVPLAGPIVYGIALSALGYGAYWYAGYRDLPGLVHVYQQGEAESAQLREELNVETAQAET